MLQRERQATLLPNWTFPHREGGEMEGEEGVFKLCGLLRNCWLDLGVWKV